MVGAILSQLANRFTTREQIKKLESFVDTHKSEYGALTSITRGLTTAEFNLNWADQNMPGIIAYLNGPKPSGGFKPQASLLLVALVSILYFLFVQ